MCDDVRMTRRASGAMHVARVRHVQGGREYTSVLLRQSYREGRSVKHRTLASLTALPPAVIDAIERSLRGEHLVPAAAAFRIVRSTPHGHVAAVLGVLRTLGLEALLDRRASRSRDLALAMVVARLVAPCSKLATARTFGQSTLGSVLDVADASEDELYGALDWLLARQARVERALARRHLASGSLVLYDVSSTYVEGTHCPLAAYGHSRDHRPDRRQIVFGLVTDARGCPVAVEVFAYRRRTDAIAEEAALDGLYVVRTSVSAERLGTSAVVETYKRLSAVERDFRALKGEDLLVRPIFHWRENRVRAHLFLCFLAAYQILAEPTPLQARAFELIGVSPATT